MNLPETAGVWVRARSPKRIDETTIFSYMDGAGEMYLGYRFDHLDAYEYTAAGRDPILVELYWMRTADDAFGLLSMDWGGEPIVLQPAGAESDGPQPPSRALFGGGLLRIWSDALYARVLASRETPESREQVLALGRAIVSGRRAAPPPALLRLLPDRTGTYRIRWDRVWFLRSHLVLNSAYFLASQNILDLSTASEAALAAYDRPGSAKTAGQPAAPRPHVLVVRYPDATAARRAFEHFHGAYFPDGPSLAVARATDAPDAHRTEHGWVGFKLRGETLMLVFDAPDDRTARAFVEATGQ